MPRIDFLKKNWDMWIQEEEDGQVSNVLADGRPPDSISLHGEY